MQSAFRGHYEPAVQQILPAADPYIAALVLEANHPQSLAASGPAYHGAGVGSREKLLGELAPPQPPDYSTSRIDRRQTAPPRSIAFSRHSRRMLAGALA